MAGLAVGLLAAGTTTAIGYGQYAAMAYAVGSAIGSMMDKSSSTAGSNGARLSDTKVTISTYGAVIPKIYGTFRTNGNLIWTSGIKEHKHKKKSGGKGGLTGRTTTTNYTYTISFAMMVCGNEITTLRKWFANGNLVIDNSETNTGPTSSLRASSIKVYYGTEDQMPDPTIQSIEGEGNVEAYRGISYVVVTDMQLEDFNNTMPNFTFEVVGKGGEKTFSLSMSDELPIIGNVDGAFYDEENQKFITNFGSNDRNYSVTDLYSNTTIVKPFPIPFAEGTSYNSRICKVGAYYLIPGGNNYVVALDSNMNFVNKISINEFESYDPSISDISTIIYNEYDLGIYTFGYKNGILSIGRINSIVPNVLSKNYFFYQDISSFNITSSFLSFAPQKNKANKNAGVIGYNGKFYFYSTNPNASSSITTIYEIDIYTKIVSKFLEINNFSVVDQYGCLFDIDEISECIILTGNDNTLSSQYKGAVKKINIKNKTIQSFFISTAFPGYNFVENSGFQIGADRRIMFFCSLNSAVFATLSIDPDNFNVYSPYEINIGVSGIGLNYSYYNSEQQSYLTFDTVSKRISKVITDRYSKVGVPLSNILSDLCKDGGLLESDIDVSQMNDIIVNGYGITNNSTLRSSVEQLSVPFNFNVVESEYKLKFLKNKSNIVKVLDIKELGCVNYTSQPTFDNDLTTVRKLESDLPRTVNITYVDTNDDYNQNTQQASRENVTTQTVSTVEMPISLTADEAKNIAQRILYDSYTQRSSYAFSLNYSHLDLEAGDTIQVVDGTSNYTMKISKIETDGGMIKIDAIAYNSYTYDQYAIGAITEAERNVLNIISKSNTLLLDIPLLTNDDFVGFYAGSSPTSKTIKWNGSVLYSSNDGSQFNEKNGFFEETNNGFTKDKLGDFTGGNVFDTYNSVTVVTSEELSNVTQEQVLNGENTALVGNEIIQFMNAELVSPNTYKLSVLLRARYATEKYLENHNSSEIFVLLDRDTIQQIEQNNVSINTNMFYKNVTFGKSLNETTSISFVNTGNNQKPPAVENVQSSRSANGDLNIVWIPRLRGLAYLQDYSDAFDFDALSGYQVDILNNAGKVLRTASMTTTSFTYTSVMQIADFGTNQTSINIKIYKMNNNVGRGYERVINV